MVMDEDEQSMFNFNGLFHLCHVNFGGQYIKILWQ
jgi:hypothetical protein